MFSIRKQILVGLVLGLASVSWGLPKTLSTCAPNLKTDFQVMDKSIALSVSGKDEQGNPIQSQGAFNILASEPMTPADFDADTMEVIKTFAGIDGFTTGEWLDVAAGSEAPTSVLFFEYAPGQYSVLWIINGYPLSLGRTSDCKP